MGRILSAADLEGSEVVEALQSSPKRILSAADLEGSEVVEAPSPAAKPEVSKVKSLAYGAAQGGSLGFFDEVMGVAGMALGVDYKRVRDHYRGESKKAEEANPKTYLAGNLGGGVATALVPGLGVAKAATAGRAAWSASKVGAAAGVGSSEKTTALGLAADAIKGGAAGAVVGGALHGVGRTFSGAVERADRAAMGNLTDGIKKTTADKLVGIGGRDKKDVVDFLKSAPDIKRAVKGEPETALARVQERMSKKGDFLDETYTKVEAIDPAVSAAAVEKSMAKIVDQYDSISATQHLASAAKGMVEDLRAKWGDKIPVSKLREEIRARSNQGQAANVTDVPAAKMLNREMAQAMRGALHEHIEATAKKAPNSGIDLGALQTANKEMSLLYKVEAALEEKARRAAEQKPTFGTIMSKSHLYAGAKGVARNARDWLDENAIAAIVKRAQSGNKAAAELLTKLYGSAEQAAAAHSPEVVGAGARALGSGVSRIMYGEH